MRRFNHRKALLITWAILVIWAAALGVWWQRIETLRRSEVALQPTPTSTVPSSPTAVVEATPYVIATPAVEPVVREPDEIARDYLKLAYSFDEEQAFEVIQELSKPEYAGRQAGSTEGHAAADYLVNFFREYGLQPAGPNGSYFQDFPVPYHTLTALPVLTITSADGKTHSGYKAWQDFAPFGRYYAGSGQAEGPIVWANYCEHNDFDYVDATGKIVLCRAKPRPDPLRNAVEHGAAGLLLIARPSSYIDRFVPYEESLVPSPIPVLIITGTVVSDILAGTGLSPADLTLAFKPVELPARAHIEVEISYSEATGRNILGVLPGRDPAHRDEVIILGAHYDHLGISPDGTYWAGANDNASGVSVLLEIARQWAEHGYVPRRTVLFALWDGEEQGLVGSSYYVEHPSYPLTSTLAMIQLDMVGKKGGQTLLVDGAGEFAQRMATLAQSLGYRTTVQETGGSDHASFRKAGVPAVLFIWWDMKSPLPTYHRPADLPETIEPETLRQTGVLVNLALLTLAEAEPAIGDSVLHQQSALAQGDELSFLETIAPQARESLRAWFRRWQKLQTDELTIALEDITFGTDVATATLKLKAHRSNQNIAFTLKTRWILQGGQWLCTGPAVQKYTGGGEVTGERTPTLTVIETTYRHIADLLGLEPLPFSLYIGPDPAQLKAWALDPDPGGPVWVGQGEAFIQTQSPITATSVLTPTLVQVLLSHYNVRDKAPWLWDGLPMYLQAAGGTEPPVGSIRKILTRSTPPEPGSEEWRIQAWAMTTYLGLEGVRDFLIALAQGYDPCAATGAGEGTAALCPQNAWADWWRTRIARAEDGIALLLRRRADAISSGDEAAFLDTVNPEDPSLLLGERRLFAALAGSHQGSIAYEEKAQLLALDESGAVARLRLKYTPQDGQETSTRFDVRFIRQGNKWYYAGPVMLKASGKHFAFRYPPSLAPMARKILDQLERRVNSAAGVPVELLFPQGKRVEIWLYQDQDALRLTTAPTLPAWVKTWPGPPVKHVIEERQKADALTEAASIAKALINQVLSARGIETPWLRHGLAACYTDLLFPEYGRRQVLRRSDELLKASRRHQIPSLLELDFYPDDQKAAFAAEAFAWSAACSLVKLSAQDRVALFLERTVQGWGESAFRQTFGFTQREFDAVWQDSIAHARIPREFTRIALAFDASGAMDHIRTLASPEFAGREAGTEGGQKAAIYIAKALADYGLKPAGDGDSFFQEFPIICTRMISTPQLIVAGMPFTYGVDFRELTTPVGKAGIAEGQLVWVRDGSFAGMDLTGKIAVRLSKSDPQEEIRKAVEHNAIGLILIKDASKEEFRTRRLPKLTRQSAQLPAVQINSRAFERMITYAGYTLAELNNAPPALPLDIYGRIVVSTTGWGRCTGRNVLALLPGRDSSLAHEVLILSAHYDHMGTSPDGVLFPGANDDASGVATLLEIARLWSEEGFTPRRTVLFAFWDAEERGSEGSQYFIAHPTVPITNVSGMLHLDNVAQGDGYYLIVEGDRGAEGEIMAWFAAAAQEVSGRLSLAQPERSGDHVPFREAGIPAVLTYWEGSDDDANSPTDVPESLDERKLRTSGRVVALATMMLSWW